MSSFATRVARLSSQIRRPVLDEVEIHGDPHAIAAQFIDLHSRVETRVIGAPRASKLYDSCIRQHILGTHYAVEHEQRVPFKQKVTFSIGNAVHWWLQNQPDVFGDRRIGWWKCMACRQILYFGRPPRKRCQKCNAYKEAIHYHEHYLNLKKPLAVTGHPDLFFEKAKAVFRVTEIKTITGDEFDKLVAPPVDHEWQIQTYMWGCGQKEAGLPVKIDDAVGYVLYISKKQHRDKLPLKMFPVRRDQEMVGRIKAKLKLYTTGRKDFPANLSPLHKECRRRNFQAWRSRSCPVLRECQEHDHE